MNGLARHRVLVTGGASGIGRATCERLAAEGARVAVVDRNAALAREVANALPGAVPIVADVSVEDEVRSAVEQAVAELGGLTGLATVAGIFHPDDINPAADVSIATFSRVLAINLTGTFAFVHYALPHLLAQPGSAVVTVASTAALRGHGHGSGYTAAKGGVVALTRLLAVQYGPQGLRVNCVCPGATDTPMTGGIYHDPEHKQRTERSIPLRRVAEPAEIGNVICQLLSDDASYVHGQVLTADGGATIL